MKKIICLFCVICCLGVIAVWHYSKKQHPLVSVVMPIYNRPDLAPRSIESILNQTFTDFEFIIVDDGSNNETKKLLQKYADKDNRIRLIHNPKNRGIAYSRQRGLDEAKGVYIATMDSDDWSVPDRLEKSLAFMADYPEIDAMTGRIVGIEKNEFIPKYTIKNPSEYAVAHLPGFFEVELMFYNNFPNVSSFFKREFTEKKHIRYNPDFVSAEDYDFWRQVAVMGGKMASMSDILVYVRSHSSNSPEYYSMMGTNSIEIHKKMLSRFFVPTKDELKFEYSTYEKCLLLQKIKRANLKNPQMPQIYLENRYHARCPIDLENAYYLKHHLNKWEGYLEHLQDDVWKRTETNDRGRLVKIGDDKIEIQWLHYPKESFVRQSDGTWKYVLEGKKITLHHINWRDDFILDHTNKGCRVRVNNECAKIKKVSDDIIWVDWMNSAWSNEEFKKNDSGTYKFVRELTPNEKI